MEDFKDNYITLDIKYDIDGFSMQSASHLCHLCNLLTSVIFTNSKPYHFSMSNEQNTKHYKKDFEVGEFTFLFRSVDSCNLYDLHPALVLEYKDSIRSQPALYFSCTAVTITEMLNDYIKKHGIENIVPVMKTTKDLQLSSLSKEEKKEVVNMLNCGTEKIAYQPYEKINKRFWE